MLNARTLGAATVLALIASIPQAHATLQLAADVSGALFTCVDQDFSCDTDHNLGALALGTTTINGVDFTGSFQLQQVGQTNALNTSSSSIINHSGANRTITVAVGATDYQGPVTAFSASGSGTFQSALNSTVRMTFFADPLNAQGADTATDTPGSLLADSGVIVAGPGADAFSFAKNGPFADLDAFSLTEAVTGTLRNGGQLLGRSQAIILTQIPEPGSRALLAGALLGFVLLRRRRA